MTDAGDEGAPPRATADASGRVRKVNLVWRDFYGRSYGPSFWTLVERPDDPGLLAFLQALQSMSFAHLVEAQLEGEPVPLGTLVRPEFSETQRYRMIDQRMALSFEIEPRAKPGSGRLEVPAPRRDLYLLPGGEEFDDRLPEYKELKRLTLESDPPVMVHRHWVRRFVLLRGKRGD